MLTIIVGIALGLPLLLYLMQDHLIFHPQPAPPAAPRAQGRVVETVRIPVADGIALSGWLARVPGATGSAKAPLIIYFGGNAEEVSWMAEMAPRFARWSLLAVNYRGYGGNPGAPGEKAMFADALILYDWAAARADVDPTRMAVIGRSLGSGVAVHVAIARKPAGVVLITPYDSITAVAQALYRFVPVSLLLRHPFDSLARAPSIEAPMLALVAAQDRVIPPVHARRLFEAWRGEKKWHEIPGAGHNDIDADPAFWAAMQTFLESLERT